MSPGFHINCTFLDSMHIRFVLAPQMLMNMRVSWLLGRLRRLLPLIVLAILVFMFYSMTTRPLAKAVTSLPSPPTPPSLANHWVVINSSNGAVCSSLASEFFQWTVLVVSVNTVPKYSHSRCIFLSDDDLFSYSQRYTIEPLQQMAVAYLYAISHGAVLIYVAQSDSDLSWIQRPPHPLLGHSHYGLVFNATAHFSPALHFGCKMSRQRPSTYFLSSNHIPAIHTPALLDWPLSSPNSEVTRCPTLGPPVILAKGTYVNMSLDGSTFTRDAFWALPVYDWTRAETERLRWHQLVQWLLWQTGKVVRVYWDGTYQEMQKKFPQWTVTSDSDFVPHNCNDITFDDCATLEASKLNDKSHLHSAMLHWFDALRKVGYSFPKLVYQSEQRSTYSLHDTTVWFLPVDFSLPTQLNIRAQKPYVSVANVNISKKLYEVTCGNPNRVPLPTRQSFTWDISIDFSRPWHQFHDVLLVIIFNVVHYDVIPYLEILYRSFFPNILFCGPTIPDLDTFPQLKQYKFSFVTHDHSTEDKIAGSLNYECMIKAMQMRYQVDGYLAIADDLLLLVNPLTNFPRNVVWYLPVSEMRIGDLTTLRECRLGMCDFYPHWHWWEDYVSVTMKLFRTMKEEQWTSLLLHHCYSELVRLNGGEFRANGGYSDVYYIPSRLAEEFSELAQMFLKEKVFLELAVPTIIRCLELPEDIRELPGKQVWDLDRDQPWKYFLRSQLFEKTYLHPAKWSGLVNRTMSELVSLYCDYVIPFLFDPYARFKM